MYSVDQGDVLDIEITYFGTKGQNIYSSFYIDNEIASVFEGADYNKCYIDNAHKTIIHARIDTKNMTKGTHICYSMCGNIEFCNYNPTKSFILQVNWFGDYQFNGSKNKHWEEIMKIIFAILFVFLGY